MLQIIGWILIGFLLLLFLLLLLPLSSRLRFDGTLQVWCGLGPIHIKVIPLKKKKTTGKKKQKKPKKPEKEKESTEKSPRIPLSFDLICKYLHLAGEALASLRHKLIFREFTFHTVIAGSDAASTALHYGQAAAAVSALYPVLESSFRIRKSDWALDVDFEKTEPSVLMDVTIAACPLRLLIAAAILYRKFRAIQSQCKPSVPLNERKGDSSNEQHQ